LVWNVTGYEWTLPIDEVEARVQLPRGVAGVTLEVQTGARGSKEQEAAASWDEEGVASFQAMRPFQPSEGLAVIVKWPKGFVREPVEPQIWWWYFLGNNRSAMAGLTGLLLVLTYYILVGRQVARDPQRGIIVPRCEVPAGLSPAAIRVVRTGNYDERAFAATVVQMAIKGYLDREEQWSRQCAHVLARTQEAGRSYQPTWCQTESVVGGWSPAPIAGTVGDALCAAIASSVAAPGSKKRPAGSLHDR